MKNFPLANARLLYKKCKPNSEWVNGLLDVDNFIEAHPRLQRTSDQIHLYFFTPGAKVCGDEDIWVAREICGFLGPGESDDFGTYDLGKGVGFGTEFDLEENLLLSRVMELEEKARKAAISPKADTWRVSFERKAGKLTGQIGLF